MKKERGGAYGQNCPFLLPPVPFLDRNRGGVGRGGALGTTLPGTAAAGERGKTERETRGFDSPTYFERRWPVEACPRRPAGGGGAARGGGAGGLGRGHAVVEVVVELEGEAEG